MLSKDVITNAIPYHHRSTSIDTMYVHDIVSSMTRFAQQDLSKRCRSLESPNPWAVFLAAFILVGILVSYFPQHYKIISRRSSEGLSPWWVLLGSLSSIAAIGNILVLPASRADIRCCQELDGGSCAAALLGVAQIGCQWACFMFMYVRSQRCSRAIC